MGVTVSRNKNQTKVHVWKSRFKWVGAIGDVELNYDLPTGRYSDKSFAPQWNEWPEL